ncbi:hypothetical protein SSP35_12_01740 [Streptomyces sp. NBRC 110611]|uniref:hypothetical protein n=1 Tax=Streptomyces sp. NBRC 110611 TaxID=1621259 RepID=UPI00082F24C4|nr:hypothetical protein [Streptomyces sp. NBRC 110611]GAU69526.1 hypothetical protein SSP35_12_01740 [Streptomyces sp. NBRC 110611]
MNTEDTPRIPDHPKERGRRSPVLVASVAAAVLLAGGGAAYWASSASGRDDAGAGTGSAGRADPPPLALDGYTGGSIAVGEPNPQGAKYRAVAELPDGPDSAPVYRPEGEISRASVERLAKALDVAGKVRSEGTTWKVGEVTPDARGPFLQVSKAGSGSWTFSQYGTPGGTNCAQPASPKGGTGQKSSTGQEGPGGAASSRPGCPSYRGGDVTTQDDGSGKDAVSPERAERAVRPVLAALGQQDARLDTSGLSGAVRIVTADPVLGGLPTYGWQSDLQVGSDGQVVGGSGQLAQPVKGAVYPVLSAGRTLDRLNSGGGRTPAAGCPSAPARDAGKGGIAPCEPAPTKAQKPAEVTGARFGLAMQYVSGGPALVPSWLYTVRQPDAGTGPDAATATVAHPAVDPKYLAHKDPAPRSPSGKPGAMALESYAVGDGDRKLTVHFWGGVCSVYSVGAEESATAVKVTVTGRDKEPGQVCVKIAKEFTRTVTLERPLDGRKVIDVSTGQAVPKR